MGSKGPGSGTEKEKGGGGGGGGLGAVTKDREIRKGGVGEKGGGGGGGTGKERGGGVTGLPADIDRHADMNWPLLVKRGTGSVNFDP